MMAYVCMTHLARKRFLVPDTPVHARYKLCVCIHVYICMAYLTGKGAISPVVLYTQRAKVTQLVHGWPMNEGERAGLCCQTHYDKPLLPARYLMHACTYSVDVFLQGGERGVSEVGLICNEAIKVRGFLPVRCVIHTAGVSYREGTVIYRDGCLYTHPPSPCKIRHTHTVCCLHSQSQ